MKVSYKLEINNENIPGECDIAKAIFQLNNTHNKNVGEKLQKYKQKQSRKN